MLKEQMATGINVDLGTTVGFCEACVQAKAARKPFPKRSDNKDAKAYGDKVVIDLWGPAEVPSLNGSLYSANYEDVATHKERVDFLKKKSGTFESYKAYKAWVKVHHNVDIIKIRGSDRGGNSTAKSSGSTLKLVVHAVTSLSMTPLPQMVSLKEPTDLILRVPEQ